MNGSGRVDAVQDDHGHGHPAIGQCHDLRDDTGRRAQEGRRQLCPHSPRTSTGRSAVGARRRDDRPLRASRLHSTAAARRPGSRRRRTRPRRTRRPPAPTDRPTLRRPTQTGVRRTRDCAGRAGPALLDEPFAGVDKRSEASITALLREEAAAGSTVFISTHDLHSVPDLADQGQSSHRRVAHGDPAEVVMPNNLVRAFGLDPLEHRRARR